MRPGYVRPGLSVDEAYRRWNMRLVRERKKLYKEKMKQQSSSVMYYPKMFCEWCLALIEPVEVHGHYQCTNCGKNVDECCQGETMDQG